MRRRRAAALHGGARGRGAGGGAARGDPGRRPGPERRRPRARSSPASAVPRATWPSLNAGAAIYAGGRCRHARGGRAGEPSARSTTARRRRRWSGSCEPNAELAPVVNRLDPIVAATREEVRAADARPCRRRRSSARAARRAEDPVRPFREALARPGVSLIAEHKRRSPSAGPIREDLALEDVVGAYERGGAAALSILTEGPNFGGSLEDLRAARARRRRCRSCARTSSSTAYQLLRVARGRRRRDPADRRRAAPSELAALHARGASARARRAGRGPRRARARRGARTLDAAVIGINNRDLATLEVDTRAHVRAAARASRPGAIVVAESGFRDREQLDELERAGVDAVLIGEALMRSPDIEAACRARSTRRAERRGLRLSMT